MDKMKKRTLIGCMVGGLLLANVFSFSAGSFFQQDKIAQQEQLINEQQQRILELEESNADIAGHYRNGYMISLGITSLMILENQQAMESLNAEAMDLMENPTIKEEEALLDKIYDALESNLFSEDIEEYFPEDFSVVPNGTV